MPNWFVESYYSLGAFRVGGLSTPSPRSRWSDSLRPLDGVSNRVGTQSTACSPNTVLRSAGNHSLGL